MNNRTFTKIDLNDCFSYAQPGFPALPVYPAQLLLPQGASVADLHVTYKELQEIPNDVLNKPIFLALGLPNKIVQTVLNI